MCKPGCPMVGEDGNAFAIIARVSKALQRAGQPGKAKEWREKAVKCPSYDALLQLMFRYVDPV